MDNYNMILDGYNPDISLDNESNNAFLDMSTSDMLFVGMLVIIVLIILFSNKPVVSDAVESIQRDMTDNRITDYIMCNISRIYVLNKKDKELNSALTSIKTPLQSSSTISYIKKSIDLDAVELVHSIVHGSGHDLSVNLRGLQIFVP